MITSTKTIIEKARNEGYAVGAFNTVNLETTKAIIDAASEMKSPVIVQVTEKTMEYAGSRMIFNIVKNYAEFYASNIPIAIHLDHGKSFEIVEKAINIGFPSVMYDGSRKKVIDNIEITKKIVKIAHDKDVTVQAELGNVPYLGEIEMGQIDWDEYMTDPEEAAMFINETGVDVLAIAIGNAHDFFKERNEPDYERLSKINELCNIPLVLHGASDWENGRVTEVVKRGISCFNVDTAIRIAFINNLTNSLKNNGHSSFDIRKSLGEAREAVKETVKNKIKYFGSANKA